MLSLQIRNIGEKALFSDVLAVVCHDGARQWADLVRDGKRSPMRLVAGSSGNCLRLQRRKMLASPGRVGLEFGQSLGIVESLIGHAK
jgi:hypothetical protein